MTSPWWWPPLPKRRRRACTRKICGRCEHAHSLQNTPCPRRWPPLTSAARWRAPLRYGQGHINDTFCVYVQTPQGDARRFILQRINTATFRDPKRPDGEHRGRDGLPARCDCTKRRRPRARDHDGAAHAARAAHISADSEGGAWRVLPLH